MNPHAESLLFSLNAAIATTRTKASFFSLLTEKVRQVFPFDALSVTLFDVQGHYKRVLYSDYGSDFRELHDEPGQYTRQAIIGTPTEQLWQLESPRTLPLRELLRLYPDSVPLRLREQAGLDYFTAVPLQRGDVRVGLLTLASRRAPDFGPDELELLAKIGGLVSLALGNTLAFEEIARRERDKTLQLLVNNALLSHKSRADLFRAVATELDRVVPCEHFLLWMQPPAGEATGFAEFAKQADGTFHALPADRWAHAPAVRAQQGALFARFAQEAAIYVSRDAAAPLTEAERLVGYPRPGDQRTLLGLPLPLRPGLTGVLLLSSRAPHLFTPADLDLVAGLVPQITLAIQNLFAFEQIEALRAQLEREKTYLLDEINTTTRLGEFVGTSAALQHVQERIRQVAPTATTVLITGETGTGKELVARALHQLSPRQARPLVKLNCAALPAHLVESELFGHEKGAFTGAVERRLGKFELADGGTIFLDEIGELPLEVQAKLLRVLQEKEFERVGGQRVLQSDVRIIAATNRVLEDEVAAGRFRADLYYRLNVFPIRVPPLRERPEDVEPLLRHYLQHFTKQLGKPRRALRPQDVQALRQYPWPGNVRELAHAVERAVIISQGPLLEWAPAEVAPVSAQAVEALVATRPLQEVERDHIRAMLERTNGQVSGPQGAAALLGLKATTLEARMKKLGVPRLVPKSPA